MTKRDAQLVICVSWPVKNQGGMELVKGKIQSFFHKLYFH